MATDSGSTAKIDVPPPPPPPPPPRDSQNQSRADEFGSRGLEPTPEFAERLREHQDKKAMGNADVTSPPDVAPHPDGPPDDGRPVNVEADSGDRKPRAESRTPTADASHGAPTNATSDTVSSETGPPPPGPPDVSPAPPGRPPDDGSTHWDKGSDGVDRPAKVGITTSYLPATGDRPGTAHGVDASAYPERQQDTGGTRPMDRENPALTADMHAADPPTETLFRGGRVPGEMVDGWKATIEAGERVIDSIPDNRPVSTSRDSTVAMMYARDGSEATQKLGVPDPSLATDLPADLPALDRPIPGHERLAPGREPGDIAARAAEAVASGRTDIAANYERLSDTVGDEGQPPTPNTDRARIANLDEVLLSGNFELVGLLDTRPGHGFRWGDVGVMRVPGTENPDDLGPVHEGVFPVFRPI